jgi:ParB family chromosome partitioning protein
MAKADDLMRTAGAVLTQSASVRPGPVGMASVAAAIGLKDPRKDGLERSKSAFSIPLAKIQPDPDQPRTPDSSAFEDEEIERLADSFRQFGQIAPIKVIWSVDDAKYRIISGERRYRAAIKAGWTAMDCIVEDKSLSKDEVLAEQVVENLLREDLEPLAQARAFHTLLTVNGWPVTRIARAVGLSHSAVSQSLKLMELPEGIQSQIEEGKISPVAGYHLAKLEDPTAQEELADRITREGLTRDQTVEAVNEAKAREPEKAARTKGKGRGARATSKLQGGPVTARQFRARNGIRIGIERAKAFDLISLLEAIEELRDQVEAEYKVERDTPKPIDIEIRKIRFGSINPNALPEAEVAAARKAIARNRPPETPHVMYDGSNYWLATGGATVAAVASMRPLVKKIPVYIHMGGQEDAERFAAQGMGVDAAEPSDA